MISVCTDTWALSGKHTKQQLCVLVMMLIAFFGTLSLDTGFVLGCRDLFWNVVFMEGGRVEGLCQHHFKAPSLVHISVLCLSGCS